MTNFVWLNKQGVRGDSGFVVQFTGRFSAEYHEGGSVVVVDVEDGGDSGGKPQILYSRSSLLRPFAGESERERVESNFRNAMAFQGLLPVAYE